MSLLAPLYALGVLAIGLPLLFHLIQRRPKGQLPFSSLMFLTASPPRIAKRSKLDNILLLLLRALALILLAVAFARPFLRSLADLQLDTPSRRLVLLIDTSASMRRDDLWQQAQNEAQRVLDDIRPTDRVALVAFDSAHRTLV
ncbi:MAG: BatA domain-containing protein, partial [Pirellulaceae bacterium]|nr:BatA domain-containing protein [Pirellulaceae bacterium]